MNSEDSPPSSSSLNTSVALDALRISYTSSATSPSSPVNSANAKAKRKSYVNDDGLTDSFKDGSHGKKLCHNNVDVFDDDKFIAAPAEMKTCQNNSKFDNDEFTINAWVSRFQKFADREKCRALERLVSGHCVDDPAQLRVLYEGLERYFQRDFIAHLPREIALKILSLLPDNQSLLNASRVCRAWLRLAEDPSLWRHRCTDWVNWILPAKAVVDDEDAETSADHVAECSILAVTPLYPLWIRCAPKASYLRRERVRENWRCARPSRMVTLRGHDEHVITCMQLCDDGQTLISGSDDTTLKVWSLGGSDGGRCVHTLVGHTGGVWCSQVTDDGQLIVSGSTDRTVRVWDARTGKCVHTLLGHTSTVRCMALRGDVLVSGSRDATLRVWDVRCGRCLHVLRGHSAAVRCVQFDGRRAVSGAYDFTVKVWDVLERRCLYTLVGHTNRVYSLQFDSDRHIVVSGSLDASIRVWNIANGSCMFTLIGHQSLTSGMQLKDRILVSGNADSTLKIWDIETGRCLYTLAGVNKHTSAVTSLQYLDSGLVATSSDDGSVKLWNTTDGSFVRDLAQLPSAGSGGCIWRLKATPTMLVCAVGSRNGTEDTKVLVYDFDADFP